MTTKGNDDTYRCDCNIIHDGVIEKVRGNMPKEDTLMDLADAFKVFSDSTRLKILCALLQEEMCVCDISVLLGMSKSAVSHQLRVLKQTNLVKNRRSGKEVYYSIADKHVETIINNGMEHVLE
ncbi:transcriptional regulator, ArsR family [Eubacterium nodatum ATCC 33099]|jgi:Predicted transcriptional regulators|nr:transcriptional regulator, ArsR family [Eubacterium nodatum ATCC 33099]